MMMMMSLVSPRAQRRVQGRGSGPSMPCAPAWGRWGHCWGQGQQWLLGAAGAHPHSLGWKLLCLAQQSPQCDRPCAVAVPVPVSLPGCGTSAGCQSPEPKLCSWGCPLLPCPAGALLLLLLFSHSFWAGVQGLCFLVLATDFLSDISPGKYCASA